MITHTLCSIPVEPGVSSVRIEIHSGIYRYFPRVYGNLVQRSEDATCPVELGVMDISCWSPSLRRGFLSLD
jgi:hypothetical protein